MKRYILTGAPGAGKTTLLRALEAQGEVVVEEAATDVIALAQARGEDQPWTEPGFIDAIVRLQRQREARAVGDASSSTARLSAPWRSQGFRVIRCLRDFARSSIGSRPRASISAVYSWFKASDS